MSMSEEVKAERLAAAAQAVAELKQGATIEMDPKPFAALMRNEAELKRTFFAIEDAIWRSVGLDIQRNPFGQLAQRGMTKDELAYRFKICEAWIRRARGDLGFSLEKTLDLLPQALRSELDGNAFDPEKSPLRIWTPT
jgi:hypothetical protein